MESVSDDLAVYLGGVDPNVLVFGALALSIIALLFAFGAFVRCRKCRSRMSSLEAKVNELQSAEEARFHADLVSRGILATNEGTEERSAD